MARTVVAYFHNVDDAIKIIQELAKQGYDPELINLAYDDDPDEGPEFDNTIELAPVIAFKDFTFGAELSEEDADYYNKLLNEGHAMVAVYVPTNAGEGREWEERTAKSIDNRMGKAKAFDHEIRKIYSNRPGLTTYPQNRHLDPIGPNKKDRRIYGSRSPLNGEVSNVIGVNEDEDYFEEVAQMGGRHIESGLEVLERLKTQAVHK